MRFRRGYRTAISSLGLLSFVATFSFARASGEALDRSFWVALGVECCALLFGSGFLALVFYKNHDEPFQRVPIVSQIADELGWSHQKARDVAEALARIVARRTRDGRRWVPTREQVLAVAEAIEDPEK
jgi:hypothetical protein